MAAALQAQAPSPADSGPSGVLRAAAAAAPTRAILDKYCTTCHNARLKTGGLALDRIDIARAGEASDSWEKVARKLRTREMPPPGAPRPADGEYRSLVSAIETTLDAVAEAAPNPGRVPVHRLNRSEYTNAVRDLLALEVDGRSLIADEPDSHGFDNVASVLTVSPALIESYLSAASTVSRLAIGDPALNAVVDTFKVPTATLQDDRANERQPFGSRGGTTVRYHFPLDGDYSIKVVLKRQLYLYLVGMGEPHQIDLRVDGALLKRFTIGGEGKGLTAPESFAGNTQGDPGWELYMHTADAGLEVRVPIKAGTRDVGVSFVRQHWEPEGVLQPPQRGFARTTNELYHGDPGVESVLVGGPYKAAGAGDTPSRRKIFVCRPTANTRASEEPCATRILSTLARRAYRRPVTADEVKVLSTSIEPAAPRPTSTPASSADCYGSCPRPRSCFESGTAPRLGSGQASDSLRARHSGLVTSSWHRAFHSSSGAASRTTSCSTWRTRRAGGSGILERQVRRMLRDARSQALVDNFANQWLKLGRLAGVVPDVDEFPDFDENLREAMQQETRLFVASQLHDDRSVVDLVSANYTFVNERLARHYGIPNVYGSRFRRVVFADGVRGGLLGQASILTATSYPNRTSPVLRGRWMLESLLGAPPPAPPPDVPALKENGADGAAHSVRERLEAHRRNPSCALCHVRMDPIGFSLENFDALGRWRTTSDGVPIDASASLPDGSRFDGVAGLRTLLLNHREDFVRTFTDRLLSYSIGRGTEPSDWPAVRKIVRETTPEDHRWSSIILAISAARRL